MDAMHFLTEGESRLLLDLLAEKYYSFETVEIPINAELGLKDPPTLTETVEVCKVQGKLAVALRAGRERRSRNPSSRPISSTGTVETKPRL